MLHTVALFGEAERGVFHLPILVKSVEELSDKLGNPPEESQGIGLGVQALSYDRLVIYFRVENEGFSKSDYLQGLRILHEDLPQNWGHLSAICLPGVGDIEILDATDAAAHHHKSLILTTEKDFYDYLTSIS